jgi:hypothetical protein
MVSHTIPASEKRTDRVPQPLPDDIIAVSVPSEVLSALDLPMTGTPPEPYSIDNLKTAYAANGLTLQLVAQRLREGLDAVWPSTGQPDMRMRLEYAIKTLQAVGVSPMPGRNQAFIQVNNQPIIRDERAVERVADIARRLIAVNKGNDTGLKG